MSKIEELSKKFDWVVFPVQLSRDAQNPNKKKCKMGKWKELTQSEFNGGTDYAIKTGKISNLIVIDFDISESDKSSLKLFKNLIVDTFTVKTGSGGYHMYFEYTNKLKNQTSARTIKVNGQKANIDIRGDGGVIFAPYTIHPCTNKPYKIKNNVKPIPLPDNVIDCFNCGEMDEKWQPILQEKPVQKVVAADILIKHLDIIKDWDSRERWYKQGMIIFNICDDIELFDKYSQKSKYYNRKELESVWYSFKYTADKKIGWPTLINFCKEDDLEAYERLNMDKWNKIVPTTKYFTEYRKLDEEDKEGRNRISREFMSHIIVCAKNAKFIGISRSYDPFGNLIWDQYSINRQLLAKDYEGMWNVGYANMVDNIVIDPSKPLFYEENELKHFNMYSAPAWNFNKLEEWIKSKPANDKVEKWLHYHFFNVISNCNEKDYEWIYNYIGNCLFNRGFKPAIWPILQSKITGTGKTTPIKKIFKEFMGPAYAAKDDSEFASKGALSGLIGKTFVLVDELKIETSANYNKLKTLISEPDITCEKKYMDTLHVRNFINGILTTNHTNPIKNMANNDRRFCQFNLNAELTQKKGYFDILNEDWQYFTYFFRNYNPKFRFEGHKTNFNKISVEIRLSPMELFIKHIIANYSSYPSKNDLKYCSTVELFEAFKNHTESSIRQTTFNSNLIELGVVSGSSRIQVNLKKFTVFKFRPREDIIKSFMSRNSGLNPIDYDNCDNCKQGQVTTECDHGKLCSECKKKCECERVISYDN